MSYGQRPGKFSVWNLFRHLGQFGRMTGQAWHRPSRRTHQFTGGGNTDGKPAKFLSRRIIERTYHPSQADRNRRRNRRQQIARARA